MFLDPYVQQLIPHWETARDMMTAKADQIIAGLEQIHRDLYEREFTELRERWTHTYTAGEFNTLIAEVPAAEEWELEVIAVNPSANGAFIIRNNSHLIFAGNVTNPDSFGAGCGLIIQGRATITFDSPGAGAGEFFVQFKRLQPPHALRRFGGGQTGEPVSPSRTPLPPAPHAPTWQTGKQLTRQN